MSSSSSSSASATDSASNTSSASATNSADASNSLSTPTPDASASQGAAATPSISGSASASPSPSAAANAATTPTGFLANKPLSISVIVIASILGLIFFILIGTWALRRRRRSKIADFADELSTDSLVRSNSGFGSGGSSSLGHGSGDVEKGVTPAGGWGVDVIEKMEAIGGARSEGASLGVGAAAMARGPSQTQRKPPPTLAYGQADYAARGNMPYGQAPYAQGPSRNGVRPGQHAVFQPQPYPSQPPTTYAAPYATAQPQRQPSPANVSPTESLQYGSHLPNPFDGADAQMSQPAMYDYASVPPMAQPFAVGGRQIAPIQRKPPPPFLTLQTVVSPVAGPTSAGSLNGPAMAPVSSINTANPPMPMVESPQDATMAPAATVPRRSSLLDGPSTPKTPKTPSSGTFKRHSRKASGASISDASSAPLHPGPPPVAPPLPSEFGHSEAVSVPLPETPVPAPTTGRVLKVVNA